jgi:cytosine/creatinine deaminase
MSSGMAFDRNTVIDERTLSLLAWLPTRSFQKLTSPDFWPRLSDADMMRIAVLLAQKSYEEGGCPIGAVVMDNSSKKILGKGHNTLIQENHPYNHGETSAMRDAGSIDFSRTTVFTTLTPCKVCATLLVERGVARVVIGNTPHQDHNEGYLRDSGVEVVNLNDSLGVTLYSRYCKEKPDQNLIDWKGVAGLRRQTSP